MQGRTRLHAGLLTAYLLVWVGLAIDPPDRPLWLVENLLAFLSVPLLAITYRWFVFSTRSYVAMFVFALLHGIGAHYGYTQVPIPWEDWGFQRNHSDRIAHFAFGLLIALPVEELLRRLARIGAGWLESLAVACTFALSAFFEVVEWLAVAAGGDLVGPREGGYLGTQGDQFDAVKDMALGLAGATITVGWLVAARWAKGLHGNRSKA
jgi:putative membrane protein